MTPRSQRLMPLLKIANRKQEKAETELALSNKKLTETREKLKQMRRYRDEYADNMSSGKITAGLLRDKQVFIQQLDQLIATLEHQIINMNSQTQVFQQAWVKARQNSDAFDRLVEKLENAEEKQRDQREQLALDDLPSKLKQF